MTANYIMRFKPRRLSPSWPARAFWVAERPSGAALRTQKGDAPGPALELGLAVAGHAPVPAPELGWPHLMTVTQPGGKK